MEDCTAERRPGLKAGLLVSVTAALIFSTIPAWAQSRMTTDFGRLSETLKIGESIVVTTDSGSEINGRFLSSSPDGIVLQVKDSQQQVSADHAARVQVRRNGVWLGALIGAGIGVPFGLALQSYAYNEGGAQAGALALPIGVGFGVGIAIDALLVKPRTVFERSTSGRSSLSVVVTSRQVFLGAALTF